MKYIFPLILSFFFIMSSCLFEEKDLFSESAALRLNKTIDHAKEVLLSPPGGNGWVMEYFPTNQTEGYTFLMHFDPNTFVTIAAKNKYTPVYTTDEGAFDVIGDNGPVLTFNTYNKVFHLFSDPKDPLGSKSSNGIGLGGDYEFIIMKVTNDLITLKGKKRGTHIIMYPLAKEQDWKGYFESLDRMNGSIFHPKLPVILTLKSNKEDDTQYFLSNGVTHIFEAKTPSQTDTDDPGKPVPFIITHYGLRLAQPFVLGTDTVQAFRLNDDKSKLVGTGNPIQAEITGEALSSLFLKTQTVLWTLDRSALSERVKVLYDQIVNSCVSVYQAEEVSLGIGYSLTRRSYELRLTFTRNAGRQTLIGNLSLSANASETTDIITFLPTGTGDNNGMTFSDRIAGFKDMAQLFSGNFLLSSETPICPAKMQFLKVGFDDIWFWTECK